MQSSAKPRNFRRRSVVRLAVLAAAALHTCAIEARALSIELKDVAPDRVERQRAATEGRLPLPRTPEVQSFDKRMAEAGLKPGAPMFMRIFKETSELEIWLKRESAYILFATYPICNWSGTLGPKMREGDKQTPEGFYTISSSQLRHVGHWPRAINLGFPNAFDAANKRDGSYILMHGGCSSVGCFAMTNPVISEIYGLAQAAVRSGQRYVPIHVFPFRMTDENLAAHSNHQWSGFWAQIAEGYRAFERTRIPPRVSVCRGSYVIQDAITIPSTEGRPNGGSARRILGEIAAGAIRENCATPVLADANRDSGQPKKSR